MGVMALSSSWNKSIGGTTAPRAILIYFADEKDWLYEFRC